MTVSLGHFSNGIQGDFEGGGTKYILLEACSYTELLQRDALSEPQIHANNCVSVDKVRAFPLEDKLTIIVRVITAPGKGTK